MIFKRWFFIAGCLLSGKTLLEARWRWTCYCMNEATKRIKGHEQSGMENYVVPLRDGDHHPNKKD